MRGLIIKTPYIDQILEGTKTWEVRGRKTNIRGTIALIRSGSKKVFGTIDIVGSQKISFDEYKEWKVSRGYEAGSIKDTPYKNTHAWLLENPIAFETPIEYKHPMGAIIWVKLSDEVTKQILK